jgi:ABC-type transporter Mla MlaB component
MSITLIEDGDTCRMVFSGSITYEFWRELEDIIISAMRRYTHFKVDLSGIEEIDLCGIHLLGVLHSVGGPNVAIVANSSIVDQTSRRLLASQRLASLGRAVRRDEVLNTCRSCA